MCGYFYAKNIPTAQLRVVGSFLIDYLSFVDTTKTLSKKDNLGSIR